MAAVDQVNIIDRLPLRVRWREVFLLILLSVLLVYLIVAENPQSDKLRNERELTSAIDNQIAEIQQTIEDIQADNTLTPEEQAALTAPLAKLSRL